MSQTTMTITVNHTKSNGSLPWYEDSISNTSPDYLINAQAKTIIEAVPGVVSITKTKTPDLIQTVLVVTYDPNNPDDPYTKILSDSYGVDNLVPKNVWDHVTAQISNQDYRNMVANVANYRLANTVYNTEHSVSYS